MKIPLKELCDGLPEKISNFHFDERISDTIAPEKKATALFNAGYNQACSDWEMWIEDADIESVIRQYNGSGQSYKAIGDAIRRLLMGRNQS